MKIYTWILAAAFFAASTSTFAAEQIGATRKVVNLVSGDLSGHKRRLGRGDPVHRDERISAAARSSAQVIFEDGTRLAVGERASIVLDKFVYSRQTDGSLVLNAARGAFRFVTGRLPSSSYEIRTPSATVGVRGTMFDVYVGGRGETTVVLLRGEADVCNRTRNCRTLRNYCDAVRVEPNGRFITGRGLSPDILAENAARRVVPFMYTHSELIRSLRPPAHTIKTCLGSVPSGSIEEPDRDGREPPDRPERSEPAEKTNDDDGRDVPGDVDTGGNTSGDSAGLGQ